MKLFSFLLSLVIYFTSLGLAYGESDYFEFPSKHYQVPKELLLAIAKQESNFNPWAINIQGKGYFPQSKDEALKLARSAFNKGESFDVGLMQINIWWLKKYNIPLETALEPESNVIIGAFILALEIQKFGLNWKAVASYHTPLAKNPERGRQYASNIVRHLTNLGEK